MAIYAIWNNKGNVGKSYLTFQIASEYAKTHPLQKILVIDLCPQAKASGMLLGGMIEGEKRLEQLGSQMPRQTIAGYIADRIMSPYVNPKTGTSYLINVTPYNQHIPDNLYLVSGDEQLEVQASRVASATHSGQPEAWSIVHTWISDLIADVKNAWNQEDMTVFLDCNPSFSIYTELALLASNRLIIPFSADVSSKRAVKAVLSLLYGIARYPEAPQSEFYLNSHSFNLNIPEIYCYVGNRLTPEVKSVKAFKTIVSEIGEEIWSVWQNHKNGFRIHPAGAPVPTNRTDFNQMFQAVVDVNTASVVSSALGIPLIRLTAGIKQVSGKNVTVNPKQLSKQQANIQDLVSKIE